MSAFGATPGPIGPAVAGDRAGVVGTVIGRPSRGHARACGGAGDVRAVAVAVERVRVRVGNRLEGRIVRVGVVVVADEVGAALDAGTPTEGDGRRQRVCRVRGVERRDRARATKVRVRVVDAGVDHGDLDVFAVQSGEAAPGQRSADQLDALDVVRHDPREAPNSRDALERLQAVELRAVDPHLDAVVGDLVIGEHLATERLDLAGDRVLLALQIGLDRGLLARAELAPCVGLDDRDRVAGHLEDDGGLRVAKPDRCPLRIDNAVGAACLRCAGGGATRYDREGRKRQQSRCYERAPRAHGSESHMCLSPVSESESRPGWTAQTSPSAADRIRDEEGAQG